MPDQLTDEEQMDILARWLRGELQDGDVPRLMREINRLKAAYADSNWHITGLLKIINKSKEAQCQTG